MPRSATLLRLGIPAIAVTLLAAGCAKSKAESGGSTTAVSDVQNVTVSMTDATCTPSQASIGTGPVTFKITNTSASAVTEVELKQGGTILGEKENLTPGLSGSFSLWLKPGKYTLYCPNAKTENVDFAVTGTAAAPSQNAARQTELTAATAGYKQYVIAEVDKLVPATTAFTNAVRAGDLATAKAKFATARSFYEEVEPVAESFGDLDPGIDARIADVDDPSKWTGFHRIEKALWVDKSLAGMTPIANKLDADVAKLKTLVATTDYQPAQLANGATELLNEVASSKITGEEDQYSHTDLSDFQANVAGAKKAFDLLAPALNSTDPALAKTVTQEFANVQDSIKPYQQANGTFADYSTVTEDQRRVLTQKVDALAEPLSQVAAKVTG